VDILYLLIPLSAVLVLVIVAIFGWAVHAGQFDEVEREGERLLRDEALDGPAALDEGQPGGVSSQQESPVVDLGEKTGGS
jgi:cbb3-type cytochrome oxidase maturation protein